jgi:hypothetical protein
MTHAIALYGSVTLTAILFVGILVGLNYISSK